MAKLNLSQAAKAVGKNRVTIWRHINAGKLSSERDYDGNPCIDTSELIRVYGKIKHDATPLKEEKQHHETPGYEELIRQIELLKKEQAEMKELVLELRNRLEHKKPDNSASSQKKQTKPELDPEWPVEVRTMADVIKRREITQRLNEDS